MCKCVNFEGQSSILLLPSWFWRRWLNHMVFFLIREERGLGFFLWLNSWGVFPVVFHGYWLRTLRMSLQCIIIKMRAAKMVVAKFCSLSSSIYCTLYYSDGSLLDPFIIRQGHSPLYGVTFCQKQYFTCTCKL